MTSLSCCDLWHLSVSRERASNLDAEAPGCICEAVSLRAEGGPPVGADELVARILTSPDGFDEDAGLILHQKLLACYSLGLSVLRQGATDQEITLTIEILTQGLEHPRTLFGAALTRVSDIRQLDAGERFFAVYATDAPYNDHHADIMGTAPKAESKNQARKAETSRRKKLRDLIQTKLLPASNPPSLIAALRSAGF